MEKLAVARSQAQDTYGLSRQCYAIESQQPDNNQPSQTSVCTVCSGSVAEHWWLKPEVSWVQILVTAGFSPLYFCLITSRYNLTFTGNTSFHNSTLNDILHLCQLCWSNIWASASLLHITRTNNFIDNSANAINVVGAIYEEANISLSFSGTTTLTHNLVEVVHSSQLKMLQLHSMEPTTSLTTQQKTVVVQTLQHIIEFQWR